LFFEKYLSNNMSSEAELKVGDRVKLHSLKSKKLNGKSGRIISPLNKDGRWPLRVDGMSKGFNVKPSNLKRVVAEASLQGMNFKGAKFYPTEQWKELPQHMACPSGCEYKMDMKTGKSFVRLQGGCRGRDSKMDETSRQDLNNAISWGKIEDVKSILKSGGKPSEDALGTALHQAAKLGNTEICKILLDHGAKAGYRNNVSMTPFHSAMAEGHSSVLLEFANRYKSKRQFDRDSTRFGKSIFDYGMQNDFGAAVRKLKAVYEALPLE